MPYVIGIDTGGTCTDSVLLDTESKQILKKAKAFTTKDNLAISIGESLSGLGEIEVPIDKIILSTTLATNAVVENRLSPVGLLFLGKSAKGTMPACCYREIRGKINIKGREEIPLDEEALLSAAQEMLPKVQAFAVAGYMSMRNPVQEKRAAELLKARFGLPVVCGHELSGTPGFAQRAATAVLNAALLPLINEFISAIKQVVNAQRLYAPIFLVRGDGTIADLATIAQKPIDTILSGPAASVIGAKYLTTCSDALIADMGGTTTDTAVLRNNEIDLCEEGASIGGWQTKVPSAAIRTCGLGGDSVITVQEGSFRIGPQRGLPLCRGGNTFTPTDVLHCNKTLNLWNGNASQTGLAQIAEKLQQSPEQALKQITEAIVYKLKTELPFEDNGSIPIIALGAPAKPWFEGLHQKTGIQIIFPEYHEVANAVGAAGAELKETVTAIVRPGEDGHGFLLHTPDMRKAFTHREEAEAAAISHLKTIAESLLTNEGAKSVICTTDTRVITTKSDITKKTQYIETRITVTAKGYFI